MSNENLHQQDTDFDIINLLSPFVQYRTFIDIGAEKGTFAELLMNNNFTGTLFEPLPKHEPILKKLVENTHCVFLPFAIDDKDGTAEFHIACDDTGEPLDYFHSLQRLEGDQRVHHNQSIPVTCRSLQNLYRDGIINKYIGILKTDTEGNDLHVLRGLGEVQPEVIVCEFFMPGIYAGWEQGNPLDLIAAAKNHGFEHYIVIKRFDLFESLSIDTPLFGNKQWGNLIFINNTLFEKTKDSLEKFIKQANANLIEGFQNRVDTLNAEIDILRTACDERLALINQLDKRNITNVLPKTFLKKIFKRKQKIT